MSTKREVRFAADILNIGDDLKFTDNNFPIDYYISYANDIENKKTENVSFTLENYRIVSRSENRAVFIDRKIGEKTEYYIYLY
jgi:hypothetical protein